MAILIDPPAWPAHGRLWSHLVSDSSVDELHDFAARHGIPRRGFERDHYDVPADAYQRLVEAGASPVSSREVVRRLAASGLRRRKVASMATRAVGNALLRPPRLRTGDLVAVTATAGVVPEERLRAGVDRLRQWGLRVRLGDHVLGRHPTLSYLAAGDVERADDFTRAWMDPDVSAVVAARGGYGTQRILDLLEWKRLAEAEPKLLVGFSDVTALHQACASRLGLATVHSHVVTSLARADEASGEVLRRLLMEPAPGVDLLVGSPAETVTPGRVEGVLVGGNLSLLAAEVGTRFSRPAAGGIVVLEDVDEPPYRIDRMLTQLIRSGWFDDVQGVVFGAFTGSDDSDEVGAGSDLDALLLDRMAGLGVPAVKGFDFGHVPTSASVPLGVRAVLDASAGTLTLPESPLT